MATTYTPNPTIVDPVDVNGAELYVDDEVIDLARRDRPVVRICSFPKPGKVFLTSGVITRADRVEYRP